MARAGGAVALLALISAGAPQAAARHISDEERIRLAHGPDPLRQAKSGGISAKAKKALLDPRGWHATQGRGGKAEKWIRRALKDTPTSDTAGGDYDNSSCLPSRYRPTNVTVQYNSNRFLVGGTHTWEGEPFVVQGVGYSPIPPGKKTLFEPFDLFTSASRPIWKRDIPLISKMGANVVRTWSWDSTQDHTAFLDYCHDHGLMVLLPFLVDDRNYKTLGDPHTHHTMLLDFKAFVQMVKNHPALFGYMIGNELNEMYPGQMDELLSIVNAMVDIRDEIDDVRHPLTIPFSDNNFDKKLVKKYYPWLRIDFWALQIYRDAIDDVLSNYTNLLDNYFMYVPRKPLVLTEYGIDALSNRTCERWEPELCGEGTWDIKTPAPFMAADVDAGAPPPPTNITLNNITRLFDQPIPEDPVKQALGFCYRYKLIANNNTAHKGNRNGFARYLAGGVVMEYCDEWWKGTSADARRTECPNQRTDKHTYCAENINKDNESNAYYLHEEWLGLFRQTDPPDDRMKFCVQPRLAYYAMQAAYLKFDSKDPKVYHKNCNDDDPPICDNAGVTACFDVANTCTGWMSEQWLKDVQKCSDDEEALTPACQCKKTFAMLNLTFPTAEISYCANMNLIWNNQYAMLVVPIVIVLIVVLAIIKWKLGKDLGGEDEDKADAGEESDEDVRKEDALPAPSPSPTAGGGGREDDEGRRKRSVKKMDPAKELTLRMQYDDYVGAELGAMIRTAFWKYTAVDDFKEVTKSVGEAANIGEALKRLGRDKVCTHFLVAQRRVYQMVYDVYMRMTMDPTQLHKGMVTQERAKRILKSQLFPAVRIVYEKYMEGFYLFKESPSEPMERVPFCELTEMMDNLALYTIVQTWAGTINHAPEKCCEVFLWAMNWFPLHLRDKYKRVLAGGVIDEQEPSANPDDDTQFSQPAWSKRVSAVRDLHHGFVEIFRTYCLKVDQSTTEGGQAFSFDDVNSDAIFLRKKQLQAGVSVGLTVAGVEGVTTAVRGPEPEQEGADDGDDDDDVSDTASQADSGIAFPGLALPNVAGGTASSAASRHVVIGTEADLLTRRSDTTGLAMTHGEIPVHKTHLEYNLARNPEESVVSYAANVFFKRRSDVIEGKKWFPKHLAFPQKGGIWALFLNFQWLIRYVLWQGLIASYLQPSSVSEPQCPQHFLMLLACGDSVWNFVAFLCHWRTLGRFKMRTKFEGVWTTVAMIIVVFTTLCATVFNSIEPDLVCQFLDGTCDTNKGKDLMPGIDVNVGSAYLFVAVVITLIDELRLFIRTAPAYAIRGRFGQKSQYLGIRIGFLVATFLVAGLWAATSLILFKDQDSPVDWWPGMLDQLSWIIFPLIMVFASWGMARFCGRCAGTFEQSAANKRDTQEEANYLVMNLIFWGLFFGVNWIVSYGILVPSVNNINFDMCKCDEREGILNAEQEDLCQQKMWVMCYVGVLFVWISAYLVAFIALYAAFEIELLVFGIARGKYVRVGNVQNWTQVESYWEHIMKRCLPRLSGSLADHRKNEVLGDEDRRKIVGLCWKQEKVWNNFVESMKKEDLLSDAERRSLIVHVGDDRSGLSKPRPNFRHKPKAYEARRRIVTFLWGLESLHGHDGHFEDNEIALEHPDNAGQQCKRKYTSQYRRAHRVRAMPTWTTLVPTYNEAIILSRKQLRATRDSGASAKRITELEYVQLTHVAEWQNFAERIYKDKKYTPKGDPKEGEKKDKWVVDADNYANDLLNCFIGLEHPRPMTDPALIKEVEMWVTMRGQTLARTIQGLCNQRDGLLQLAELEEQPDSPLERLLVMRTVQRKYQILISHQTFSSDKLGAGGLEDHLCETWRKLRYFDVVTNDDSHFQSHCLRLRDELLFPVAPVADDEKEDQRAISWSLDGVRSPPFPCDKEKYPHYNAVSIASKDWDQQLQKNADKQFGWLDRWSKDKNRNTVLEPGTLVRINPNNAGGIKQLVKYGDGDQGGKAVPLTGDAKSIAGGKWLEGRVVAHHKPTFVGGAAVTDQAPFKGWSIGEVKVRTRSATDDIKQLKGELQKRWESTPKQYRRSEKAPSPTKTEILDSLGLNLRKWSCGLLVHQISDVKPGKDAKKTWADQLLERCSRGSCKRQLTVPHGDRELAKRFAERQVLTMGGWTLTGINGKTFDKDAKDKDWLEFLCEELCADSPELVFHAFPLWGDGAWKHEEGDNSGAPQTGSLGVYEVEYDIDGRRDLVDFEAVEPFPWTKLTVQRVSRLRIGEGKAENQIHALPFATGEVMQAMDMNQYATSDQAIKVPFLLNDFFATPDYEVINCNRRKTAEKKRDPPDWSSEVFWDHGILIPPYRIVGFPEWCYTRQLSMVGDMMGAAEWCFVTINQRVLSWPLRIRTHYGHPDFFDGYWSRTRGGTSKASPLVNTNEDIFAGYEMLGRGERGTYVEFLECHKGRETSFPNATVFEGKLAQGAAQQIRSIDVYMLNRKLDVFQRFGLFFASIAFYVTNMIMSISISYYILGIVLFAMSGISYHQLGLLDAVIAVPWLIQIGYVLAIPMIVELIIQRGFWAGLFTFISTLPICVIFFVFQMRTKTYFFLRGLLIGSGGYAATGRGFGLERTTMTKMYTSHSESHFIEGLMVVVALTVYGIYGSDPFGAYLARTFTIIIIAISWLWAPIIFNPMPTPQELQVDVSVMVDWISTKLKRLRKADVESIIEDMRTVQTARRIEFQTQLYNDMQNRSLVSGGGGDGASTYGGSTCGGDTFGGGTFGGATSGRTDRSEGSDVSSARSEATTATDASMADPRSMASMKHMKLMNKLEQESLWFSSLCGRSNKTPASFANVTKKDQLLPDPESRSKEIFIQLLDINGVPINSGEVSESDVPSRNWIEGTGSGQTQQGQRKDSQPSDIFIKRLFEKIDYSSHARFETDLQYCQSAYRAGGWIQTKPLLVIRCKDNTTHSTIMQAYREATRLTDGIITMRPGDLSDTRPLDERSSVGPIRITVRKPKDIDEARQYMKRDSNFREELQYQGNEPEEKVELTVYNVTCGDQLDIYDRLSHLKNETWFVKPTRQIQLIDVDTDQPVPLVFSSLQDGKVYQAEIAREEMDPTKAGADPEFKPRITLKMRMQTFSEWSQHRIPSFKSLTGLQSQFWTSEDGVTTMDQESWTAWWYRNILFAQWESEDVFFSGKVNLFGTILMKAYLHLEFYFPWALIAFAFWRLDSVWYLILILGVGTVFKIVDSKTKDNHEYSQLLKALSLITLPLAFIYFQHGLLSLKELFWSIVFYFVCVCLATRGLMGYNNVQSRRRSFGAAFAFHVENEKKEDGRSPESSQGGPASHVSFSSSVRNRERDLLSRNNDEMKRTEVFVARLLIPRWLGIFRRMVPFLIMLLLALGTFICTLLCTWLMAMMYNGRVAEAWRKAYFRSTAAAPPSSGGGGGGIQQASASAAAAAAGNRATEDSYKHGLGSDAVALRGKVGKGPRKRKDDVPGQIQEAR